MKALDAPYIILAVLVMAMLGSWAVPCFLAYICCAVGYGSFKVVRVLQKQEVKWLLSNTPEGSLAIWKERHDKLHTNRDELS